MFKLTRTSNCTPRHLTREGVGIVGGDESLNPLLKHLAITLPVTDTSPCDDNGSNNWLLLLVLRKLVDCFVAVKNKSLVICISVIFCLKLTNWNSFLV